MSNERREMNDAPSSVSAARPCSSTSSTAAPLASPPAAPPAAPPMPTRMRSSSSTPHTRITSTTTARVSQSDATTRSTRLRTSISVRRRRKSGARRRSSAIAAAHAALRDIAVMTASAASRSAGCGFSKSAPGASSWKSSGRWRDAVSSSTPGFDSIRFFSATRQAQTCCTSPFPDGARGAASPAARSYGSPPIASTRAVTAAAASPANTWYVQSASLGSSTAGSTNMLGGSESNCEQDSRKM